MEIKVCNDRNKPYSFVSYSHYDSGKVYPILKELQANGYRIWYDQHIESGSEWSDSISEWLTDENCIKFIVFISKYSIESDNVQDEVHIARKHNKSCSVIYLEDVRLSGGLELKLDRWQSIKWYGESENILFKKILKGIPVETIELSDYINEEPNEFHKKYRILNVIGIGGSSTVYKAQAITTGAIVTVKVFNEELNNKDGFLNRTLIHEMNALAKINCPFVPKLIDFGQDLFEDNMKGYLVESYIDGITLADLRCALTENEVINITLKIANILKYLGKVDLLGLVHTDIKPANIMIDRFNEVYLIDFGGCVADGTVVKWGTTTFASPEQLTGCLVSARSDIYSLGVTMKYLLIKEDLSRWGVSFKKIMNIKDWKSFFCEMDPILALIIDKMTDEREDKRFSTIDELIQVLEKIRKKDEKCLESIILRNKKYRNTNEDDFQMPISAVLQLSVSVMAGELPDDMVDGDMISAPIIGLSEYEDIIDKEPTVSFAGYEDVIDKEPTLPFLEYEDIIDREPTVPLPDSILNAPMESIEELEKRQ